MEDLVKRKNLRSKKGKKDWARNIDVSGMQESVIQNNAKITASKSQSKPKFIIDSEADKKVKNQLQADRFIKKVVVNPSIHQNNLLKKIQKIPQKAKQKQNNDDDFDVWGQEEKKPLKPYITNLTGEKDSTVKKVKVVLSDDPLQVKAVIMPHSGQSYNPQYKAHQDFLQNVVETEKLKDKVIKPEASNLLKEKSNLTIQKLKPSGLTKKQKAAMEEEIKLKSEKYESHQFNQLKKIRKEIEQKYQISQQNLETKKQLEEKQKDLMQKGIISKTRRINKTIYKMPIEEFQLMDQLSSNLRTMTPTENALTNQFDNYYRRNQIEIPDANPKKRNRKLKTHKYHSTDRYREADKMFDQKDELEFKV